MKNPYHFLLKVGRRHYLILCIPPGTIFLVSGVCADHVKYSAHLLVPCVSTPNLSLTLAPLKGVFFLRLVDGRGHLLTHFFQITTNHYCSGGVDDMSKLKKVFNLCYGLLYFESLVTHQVSGKIQ